MEAKHEPGVKKMEWIPANYVNDNYIPDARLKNVHTIILVTYETSKGRRYVKQVLCSYGRIDKKLNGKVVAWMPLPEPYKGK